jgi:ABC-type dipeptide/oligopeptide/nickel transport system ATPase component
MYNYNNIKVAEYLQEKTVKVIRNEGRELVVHCLFGDCDRDSKGTEAHLYINSETGQYDCKKCSAQGGMKKLKDFFGDSLVERKIEAKQYRNFRFEIIDECHNNLPSEIREYINSRGVSEDTINKYRLGYGNFYGKNWITIPMQKFNEEEYSFLLLRKCPFTNLDKDKQKSFPPNKGEITLLGEYASHEEDLVICEGIFDVFSVLSKGIKAVTSTGGAMSFKDSWVDERLLKSKNIFVAYDNDKAGIDGSEKALKTIYEAGYRNLYRVTIPDLDNGQKVDANDYLVKYNQPVEDLMQKYSIPYPDRIDTRDFKEISLVEISKILSKTIVGDEHAKLITFLAMLSAFTKDSQMNVMMIGQSSSGKTYIVLEIAKLFPKESLIVKGNVSATAFFHGSGKVDETSNTTTIVFGRKIVILTENPHSTVLEKIRGLLSHDSEQTTSSITDKNKVGGHRTKHIVFDGFPSFFFCSANLNINEQEKTRFLLLSPDITDEKIDAGVKHFIQRAGGNREFERSLENDIDRQSLIKRIEAIRQEEIENINYTKEEKSYISELFLKGKTGRQAREQRDIKNIIILAKSSALINLWFRRKEGKDIWLNKTDIDNAFYLYSHIQKTQDLGIPPFAHHIYLTVIVPAFQRKNKLMLSDNDFLTGITFQDIQNEYFSITKSTLDLENLRRNIMPALESCNLVYRDSDPDKKSRRVYFFVTDIESIVSNLNNELYSSFPVVEKL